MSEFSAQSVSAEAEKKIKAYRGFGELVVGGGRLDRALLTAICMLDHPEVNQYLLDNAVKFEDRITKTKIFPREGMALPSDSFWTKLVRFFRRMK